MSIRGLINFLRKRPATLALAYLAEKLPLTVTVKTNKGNIKFYCPGRYLLWRAETLLTKEPETIEWIDSFDKDSIFWDVGASVGVYSFYAALRNDIRVLSFEPSAFNYYILNKNIELNKADDKIFSLCVALNDNMSVEYLNMASTVLGGGLNTFSEYCQLQKEAVSIVFKQGTISVSVDGFVEKFGSPFPNYIKIDTEGAEDKIIKGAKKTLSDKRLKSLLIELNIEAKESYHRILFTLKEHGFILLNKRDTRKKFTGKFACLRNHIFVRPD